MKTRKLGEHGPSVSAVGLGCMGMSFAYGATPADETESIATLHRALDLGVTFFDTAEMYGPFENEKLLGRALKGRREGLVIATKFGFEFSGSGPTGGLDSRPDHIRAVCDASLSRLGIDCIDLFYQHRVDPNVPIEDVAGALAGLVKAGKIRHLGLSEAGAQTIRRANAVHPISALQSEYSLFSRDIETDILPTCRALGIGVVPYSPLGRGILTGAVRRREDLAATDFRRRLPRFADGAIDRNLVVVDALGALAAEKGCTTAQLALAWVLAQGPDVVPIPGARQRRNLEDNCGAVEVVLTAEDLARIEAIAPKGVAVGDRNAPERTAVLNR